MNIIGELAVALGFDIDDSKLQQFGKTIDNTIVNIGKVTAAATAFIVAMDKIVDSTVKGTTALENFNAQTGLSIDKLQKLQVTSQLQNIGLTADDITGSIMNLQSKLAEIRLTGSGVKPFQILGISPINKDAYQVIEELRGAIKGIDPMIATNLISEMGLDPKFISVLQMSSNEFSELSKEIMLTTKQRQQIMQTGVEIRKLRLEFEAMINKTVARLEPVIVGFTKALEHVISAIQKLNWQIPIMLIAMGGILKFFKLLNKETLAWTIALTGLFLLLDDIGTWMRGGKSLFDYSGMFQFFDMLAKNLQKVADVINSVSDKKLTQLFSVLGAIAGGTIGGVFTGGAGILPGIAIGAGIGGAGGLSLDMLRNNAGKNSNINQTNNFNIQSSEASPSAIAERTIQRQKEANVLILNNGGQ